MTELGAEQVHEILAATDSSQLLYNTHSLEEMFTESGPSGCL